MNTDIDGGVPLVPGCRCRSNPPADIDGKPVRIVHENCPEHGKRPTRHVPAVWVNHAAYWDGGPFGTMIYATYRYAKGSTRP